MKQSGNGTVTAAQAMDGLGKLALLAALQGALSGGTPMVAGEGVEFYDGKLIRVPDGMSYQGVREVIDRAEREAETVTSWTRTYPFRPDDGAYAAAQVMIQQFGGGFGEATYSFFGKQAPELRTVILDAAGASVQVPTGRVSLPTLKDTVVWVGETMDRQYGKIFALAAEGPRKYKDQIGAFYDAVGKYLAEHSIYRKKMLVGAGKIEFIDLTSFKPNEIVFSDRATRLLETTLVKPLKHADNLRAGGVPVKRAVLLHGPYGTGKTSAAMVAALEANKAGWTVVFGRTGVDSIEDTLRTARLYQPAVVVLEDIDNEADSGDAAQVSKLLEALDGATSKGSEIVMVVTTNHLERIPKGLLRPGRFDAVVEIAELDASGIERLIRAVVGKTNLSPDVDFDLVTASMEGFFPAFVRAAVDRARTLAIAETGHPSAWMLSTSDLTDAAETLQEQLRAMNDATEGKPKPTLDVAMRGLIRAAVDGIGYVENQNDLIPDAYLMDPEKVSVNTE